jgi:hypothetical protein
MPRGYLVTGDFVSKFESLKAMAGSRLDLRGGGHVGWEVGAWNRDPNYKQDAGDRSGVDLAQKRPVRCRARRRLAPMHCRNNVKPACGVGRRERSKHR